MTREEREYAIDIIQSILDKYEEDECLATEITIGDEDIKAFKMAIKSLDQEPILEKISDEIEDLYSYADFDEDTKTCYNMVRLEEVQRVIDKYRGESER